MIDVQFEELTKHCKDLGFGAPSKTNLQGGGMLIEVDDIPVAGWNRPTVKVLFVVPPGYPAGQPDCFWVEPSNFRLAGGQTPQAANDGNAIPGDVVPGRATTWFSWHVQSWNPSRDSLITYFKVIQDRLTPAR